MRTPCTLATLTAAVLLACGCSTVRPDDFPVIEAHHPDGTGGRLMKDVPSGDAEGYVLDYAAGDEVVFTLEFESDVLTLAGPVTATVTLEAPIRVAVRPGGMLVSIDGGEWLPVLKAFRGSLSTSLSITTEDPVNRGTVGVSAYRR